MMKLVDNKNMVIYYIFKYFQLMKIEGGSVLSVWKSRAEQMGLHVKAALWVNHAFYRAHRQQKGWT